MNRIPVNNIFAAVFEKSVLDPLLDVLDKKSVRFWGTVGTVKYLTSKGFSAHSVVRGFDFDGRVKSLDRGIFARILADRTKKNHLSQLRVIARSEATKQSDPGKRSLRFARDDKAYTSDVKSGLRLESTSEVKEAAPFDLVVVTLYELDKKNFPESMDIGGQALIRAAIKNYKNVALAFDEKSINEVTAEIKKNDGSTTIEFRKTQAKLALEFIAERSRLESSLK